MAQIENMPEMDMVQDTLLGITGGRSVPRVFIDGKFIGEFFDVAHSGLASLYTSIAIDASSPTILCVSGGGDDTARLAASGELKKMLEAAGAL